MRSPASGAVDVKATENAARNEEIEKLRQKIAQLQREIDRMKKSD